MYLATIYIQVAHVLRNIFHKYGYLASSNQPLKFNYRKYINYL